MVALRGRLLASYIGCWLMVVGLVEGRRAVGWGATWGVVAIVAGGLVAAAVGWGVARLLGGRLARVQGLMAEAAGGDLTGRTGASPTDVLGELGVAYDEMLEVLSRALAATGAKVGFFGDAAEDLEIFATQINISAEESSSRAGLVAAAAEEVSVNVQTVSAAMEEMSASIQEIAKNTSDAAVVAAAAVSAVESAGGAVAKLGESSAEIGSVVHVITGIAEQTNLLALNATIEAARAGESGKGFAVVAGEVKDLAQETSKATDDISRRIAGIQADTEAAVAAIAQISEIIARINDTQATIASAVEEQTATTNEMSRNVAEAATGATEIARTINGVATATATTNEGVAQTLTASSSLTAMSGELAAGVSGFTYPEHMLEELAEGKSGSAQTSVPPIEAAINKALRAHWGWQKRLATAIAHGAHGEDVTVVARDDRCAFGTWLYGFSPAPGDRAHYETAKALHAAFHEEAARTLGLVSSGRAAESRASISKGGAFAEASRVLTNAMIEWKRQSTSADAQAHAPAA